MADLETTYNQTKQRWSIIRHSEDVDKDQVKLEIFEEGTNELLLDMDWLAKDFFKQMVDLQYEYGR